MAPVRTHGTHTHGTLHATCSHPQDATAARARPRGRTLRCVSAAARTLHAPPHSLTLFSVSFPGVAPSSWAPTPPLSNHPPLVLPSARPPARLAVRNLAGHSAPPPSRCAAYGTPLAHSARPAARTLQRVRAAPAVTQAALRLLDSHRRCDCLIHTLTRARARAALLDTHTHTQRLLDTNRHSAP